MNCTAWNSLDANALASSPSAVPSTALSTARAAIRAGAPGGVEAERQERDGGGDERLDGREQGERDPVAGQQVELGERHRHQPLERAGGALAQHRDRGDEEHRDEREHAEHRARPGGRTARSPSIALQQRTAARSGRPAAARSCAGRGGSARARARAVAAVIRGLTRRLLDQAQERRLHVLLAGALAQLVRASCRPAGAPSRISSSRSQRAASSITWLETSSVAPVGGEPVEERPQVAAQDGVEADGRLVEHEQLWPAEQRARERDARALAAGQRADERSPALGEVDRRERLADALARRAEHGARSSAGSRAR